ncbi:amidohydrolase family protein [Pseudochrobactrum sp. HB0163]|uniref:metal-dependent hydrolase family protein n=1 Tax=Pseudochrobactrum sp. HB0163 TaxID=3450708 RepID=UPI003F6DE954
MKADLGSRYAQFAHGFGCLCHSSLITGLNERIGAGLSRRSVLRGLTATMTAAATAGAFPAFAQDSQRLLLIDNIRIFDGKSAKLQENCSLLIKGKTIGGILRAGETVADAQIIDGGNHVLMPGLIDAHWHSIIAAIPQMVAMTADSAYIHLIAAEEARRTLLRGFTTIRDAGGPAFALKRAIDEGHIEGPRIYPSGAMVSQTSGHGDFRLRTDLPRHSANDLSLAEASGISAIADGEAEVLRRVREQLMLGASQIKIMVGGGVASAYDPLDSVQFTEKEIRAAVDAASDWGTYVCAHVYTSPGIQRALACGVRSIEHGQLADEETVRRMADAGAWWSIQPFLADEDANVYASQIQRDQQKMIAEGTIRAFDLGQKYNVNMAWGTDILFNPKGTATQGRQLAKIARWFDNADVLKMATGTNAQLLALSGRRNPYSAPLGVIETGALADILLINGNPLEDISLISDPDQNMKLIIKNGKIYKNTLAG